MLNVVAGIFTGLLHQLRALPAKWSDCYHGLVGVGAAHTGRRLRQDELLRKIADRKAQK